jgi:plasmid stabilization system protein ParE
MGRRRSGADHARRRSLEEVRKEDPQTVVIATRSFEANLERIERYLEEHDRPQVFVALLAELRSKVVPSLQSFPRLGYDLLARKPLSLEGVAVAERLQRKLGEGVTVREYIFGEYLLLYALRGQDLYLLAIRHHRELSFDLRSFWSR